MTYSIHNFDTIEHEKKFNLLHKNIKKRLLFLPDNTILDINHQNKDLSQHQNHLNMIEYLRNYTPESGIEHNPETDQWIWLGTYGGHKVTAIYQYKSLIRLLYKHFIQADLPDNRRLTTFSTQSMYDVNPYKIGCSLSPSGSSRFSMNLRKAMNKELPKTPFEGSNLSRVKVDELDKNSFAYRDLFDALNESGYLDMIGMKHDKEGAIQYLIGQGFNPIHSKQMVEEHMK